MCLLFAAYSTQGDRDCWFNDIVHLYNTQQCADECWANAACVGYIRNNAGTECWLKIACSPGWALFRVAHMKRKQFLIAYMVTHEIITLDNIRANVITFILNNGDH